MHTKKGGGGRGGGRSHRGNGKTIKIGTVVQHPAAQTATFTAPPMRIVYPSGFERRCHGQQKRGNKVAFGTPLGHWFWRKSLYRALKTIILSPLGTLTEKKKEVYEKACSATLKGGGKHLAAHQSTVA